MTSCRCSARGSWPPRSCSRPVRGRSRRAAGRPTAGSCPAACAPSRGPPGERHLARRFEPDHHPRAPRPRRGRRGARRLRPRPYVRRTARTGGPAAEPAAARALARQARPRGCAGRARRCARLPRRLRRGRRETMRVLIVLTGALGDVVRALPLLGRMRRARPESWIAWVVEPAAAPLLAGHPWLDEVLVFDRPAGLRAVLPFLSRLRAGAYDVALDLGRSAKTALFSRLSGAPLRVGF